MRTIEEYKPRKDPRDGKWIMETDSEYERLVNEYGEQ